MATKKKPVKKTTKAKAAKKATKPAKKAAPKKAAAKKPVKKAAPRKVPEPTLKDEQLELKRISSPILDTEKPKKPALKVIIPLILIIVVVGYLFLFDNQILPKKEDIFKETAAPEANAEAESLQPEEEAPQAEEPVVKEPVEEKAVEVTPPKPAKIEGQTYTVKHKDQLTEISKQFYGNYEDWKKIYRANKDKINDPHKIWPGQVIVIPE